MKRRILYSLVWVMFLSILSNPLNRTTKVTGTTSPSGSLNYTYRIVNRLPHDPQAFTQGLVFKDGYFYEGTGLYGRSSLRQVNPRDGAVLRQVDLPDPFFGEGITIYQNRIIQLTWLEHQAFIYDLETFSLQGTFTYATQGWGLTSDGKHLIMSDGSSVLTFLDPETYTPVHQLPVEDNGEPVFHLNELEYINGKIFANVWLSDRIAIINPATGEVTGWLDLTGLLDPKTHSSHAVDVLNGIAYDEREDRLFVTGKLWPYIFEIEILETKK